MRLASVHSPPLTTVAFSIFISRESNHRNERLQSSHHGTQDVLNEINTHQEPINGALLMPSSHGQARGDQEGTLMYKAENCGKTGLNSYGFFSFSSPVFRPLLSPLPAHGCAHGRMVLAGEDSGTCCCTVMSSSGRPILPSLPALARLPLFPSPPDTTHRVTAEQTSRLQVGVMVRDRGAETAGLGGKRFWFAWEHELS